MYIAEIAQKIVDATMEVIENRNVNIMDRDGFIIASGEKQRVNTYHKGADDVIKLGKTVEIYPGEINVYPGAKEGVNLPISIGDKIVGVVGVYGHPDEVRLTAKMVQKYVELSLEQHVVTEQIHMARDLRQQIIRLLIYENVTNSEEVLCLSKIVGIDLYKKRCAILIQVNDVIDSNSFKLLKVMNEIEKFLIWKGYLDEKLDLGGVLGEEFVFFKHFNDEDSSFCSKECLEKMHEDIYNQCGYITSIAAGSYHEGLDGYKKSFYEARTLLQLRNQSISSMFDTKCQTEFLFQQVDDDILDHFISPILNKILKPDGTVPIWFVETLSALFDNNFNAAEAAQSFYMHKNTMLYRIKKIEEMTGLVFNSNFYDALMLKYLLVYLERKKYLNI